MKRRIWLSVGMGTLLSTTVVACGGPDRHDAGTGACDQIIRACHPYDHGSGPAHECHAFAESTSTTETMCQTRLVECLATCSPGDGGHD